MSHIAFRLNMWILIVIQVYKFFPQDCRFPVLYFPRAYCPIRESSLDICWYVLFGIWSAHDVIRCLTVMTNTSRGRHVGAGPLRHMKRNWKKSGSKNDAIGENDLRNRCLDQLLEVSAFWCKTIWWYKIADWTDLCRLYFEKSFPISTEQGDWYFCYGRRLFIMLWVTFILLMHVLWLKVFFCFSDWFIYDIQDTPMECKWTDYSTTV